MAKFVLSERAKSDLVDIWRYTLETWSEEQAIRYYNKLMDGCEHIASTPDTSGRDYEEVRPGLRGMLCGRHLIFYRIISKEKVRIVRILYGKMDYPRHLL